MNKIRYFEVLDDDVSLPAEQLTEVSLVNAGYSESDAEFIMAVTNKEIDGDCILELPKKEESRKKE